jgi:hypothetical protein
VLVDDNSHYQDESERYQHGEFETYEEALHACKAIVDECLARHLSGLDSKSPAELYSSYTSFGDDPFVCPPHPREPFSAWKYAKQRCAEICADD